MKDTKESLIKEKENLKVKTKLKSKNLKEKGITLIALVVTIIILLILTGVTLNMALSDNGLFKKAKEATEKYKEASAQEYVELEVLGSYDEKGNIDINTLNDNLINNLGNVYFRGKILSETNKIEELPVIVTYNGVVVKIGEGSVKFSNIITANNYGDKVKYSADGIDEWKIFYNNDGNVFLISSDIIPNDKIKNEKITKSGQYTAYLDVSNISMDASSVSDDIAKKFLWNYRLNYKVSYANTRCLSQAFFDVEHWSNFVDEKYAESAIGAPTMEMWIRSWNEKYPNDLLYYEITDDIGYKVSYDNGSFDLSIQPDVMNTKDGWKYGKESDCDNLYFPRHEGFSDDDETCWGYFIACNMWGDRTKSGYGNGIAMVDFPGRIHTGNYWGKYYAFRPVVCLKPDVKAALDDDGVWVLEEIN